MAITDNIVSCWEFDTDGSDVAGSNPLTNNNSCTFVAGKINNATRLLTASGQYWDCVSSAGLQLGGAFTISSWIYPRDSNSWMILKKYPSNTGGSEWALYNNALTVKFYDGASFRTTGVTLTQDAWNHVVLTRATSGGDITPYLNGSAGTPFSANAITTGTNNLFVGCETSGAFLAQGDFDQHAIWSRDLSSSEVSTIWNGGSGIAYPFSASPTGQPLIKRLGGVPYAAGIRQTLGVRRW